MQLDAVRARSRRFRSDGCSSLLHPDQSKRSCREHLTSRQMLVENGQIAHPVDSEPDSAVPPGVPTPRLDLVLEPVTMGALDW